MTTNNRENLDKLIRLLNHEALFNPDPELQAKFQDLLELALKVAADYDDLLQEFVNRDLGWFFGTHSSSDVDNQDSIKSDLGWFFDKTSTEHSVDDVQYRAEDQDEDNTAASS